MKRSHRLLALTTSLALLVSLAGTAAAAVPSEDGSIAAPRRDNLHSPLADKAFERKQSALQNKLVGKAKKGPGDTIVAGDGSFVDFPVNQSDRIFVVLAEFSDTISSTYGGTAGPLHNQIPEPNRAVDNTSIWAADHNQAHFEDIYFNQMKEYYRVQSSGQYTFDGTVVDWVKVPYNEARYGSDFCGDSVCATVWYLIRDAVNQWVADRLADGDTIADIQAELATFDIQDRYDADGDGDFDEPDGYIDHFQIVHAGTGQETGGGAQGTDAIWSHRWYTAQQGIGHWGPGGAPFGGMEIGGDGTFAEEGGVNATGFWVGDYTMQPEDGGLGVFAHEYAHDLGLPDQYDTAGGENSTGFWTIMSSGSYGSNGGPSGIGTRPVDFNAWEKFQLGWLNYDVAFGAEFGDGPSEHVLGPAERTSDGGAQALFVVLPDKEVTVNLGAPYAGSLFYYSDAGNSLDNSMTKSFTLPAGAVSLNAQVRYSIETDWDYAYLTVDGTPVSTNLSTADNPNGQNFGGGITGSSAGWVSLTADLSAFADGTHDIGFRYWTDGFVVESGLQVDEIAITGQATDGAESDTGWTFDGFRTTGGIESAFYFHAYVAEYRQYRDYDRGLQTGPYNFGFLNNPSLGDWVEHFPYQDGMLVSYWDTSFTDNNTSEHPGGGLILPVDANPDIKHRPDTGGVLRARILSYDSTFSLERTDALVLHFSSKRLSIPSSKANLVFDDTKKYWKSAAPLASVIVPNTGTTIRIMGQFYLDHGADGLVPYYSIRVN